MCGAKIGKVPELRVTQNHNFFTTEKVSTKNQKFEQKRYDLYNSDTGNR